MTLKVGLTGSIGMGKSTTAAFFAEHGCDIWDADAAVARLYAPDGLAIAPLHGLVPHAISDEGVNRSELRAELRKDPSLFPKLEAIVHPLVRDDRRQFLEASTADIVIFDIPLLFETGAEVEMDCTLCVTVPPDIQRARVLARGTMTKADLHNILAQQMANDEKCRRADHVIDTTTHAGARTQVASIINDLRGLS